jgi:hypothetical protein
VGCGSEAGFGGLEAGQDAAVVDIAADADFEAAEEAGIDGVRELETGTVTARERGLDAGPEFGRGFDGVFDAGLAALGVEAEEPMEMGEAGEVPAGFGGQDTLDGLAGAGFVQAALDEATAEEGFAVAAGLLVDFNSQERSGGVGGVRQRSASGYPRRGGVDPRR